MITTFLAISTKNNFKFYCDTSLTNLETITAESSSQKINNLEKKYTKMEKKLEEIKELLMKKEEQPVITKSQQQPSKKYMERQRQTGGSQGSTYQFRFDY